MRYQIVLTNLKDITSLKHYLQDLLFVIYTCLDWVLHGSQDCCQQQYVFHCKVFKPQRAVAEEAKEHRVDHKNEKEHCLANNRTNRHHFELTLASYTNCRIALDLTF